MVVLVTGAAGFLGSKVVELLAKNASITRIVAFDNLSNGSFDYLFHPFEGKSKVTPIVGDVLDSRTLSNALMGCDAVVHLAYIPQDSASYHQLEQVNNWGTSEVVGAFENSNAKRFIFAGDVAVYGSDSNNTTLKINPSSHYQWSMVRGESHVKRLISEGKGAIVRLGELFGVAPSCILDQRINRMLFDASVGHKFSVEGNGNLERNLTSVAAAAKSIVDALLNDSLCGIFDFVTASISTFDLIGEIRSLYPSSEVVFLSHHYENRGLKVNTSVQLEIDEPGMLNFELERLAKALR